MAQQTWVENLRWVRILAGTVRNHLYRQEAHPATFACMLQKSQFKHG